MDRKHLIKLLVIWLPLMGLGCGIFSTFNSSGASGGIGYDLTSRIKAESISIIKSEDTTKGEELLKNVERILRRIPIDEEPLLFSFYGHYLSGSDKFGIDLLETAHQRNPRNRGVLQALLGNAQRNGDISRIVEETSLLYHLDSERRDQYIQILSAVYDTETGPDVMDQYLSRGVSWGYGLLGLKIRYLAHDRLDVLEKSLEAYLSQTSPDDWKYQALVSRYSNRLMIAGYAQKSFTFWSENNAVTAELRPHEFGVFNPEFLKINITPPFNWNFFEAKGLTTELNEENGLFISFRSGKPNVIARQYLPWNKPANAQLEIESVHNYDANKGQFFIEIKCANTEAIITSFDIEGSTKRGDKRIYNLDLEPHSCDFVYLDIAARPGIFGARITMTLNYLNIVEQPASDI